MDSLSHDRLQSLFGMMLRDSEGDKGRNLRMILGTPETRRIIKKWKYRTKNCERATSRNAFLPEKLQKLQPLYYNVSEIVGKEYKGLQLYSLEQALERLNSIVVGTNCVLLSWDDKWINELSLASKGWKFHSLAGETPNTLVLLCSCDRCDTKIYLDLHSTENHNNDNVQNLINERYWEDIVTKSRPSQCPWVSNQFDLSDYHLKEANLIHDITRMQGHETVHFGTSGEITHNSTPLFSQEQLFSLSEFFKCADKRKLELMLRGFIPVEGCNDAVICVRCFRKAFIGSITGSDYLNPHAPWCRYHDETKLPTMITSQLLSAKKTDDIKKRLSDLENYFESV